MQNSNKCLKIREREEVVDRDKDGPFLLSCELSVSVKEIPDRKKNLACRTNIRHQCIEL